MISAKVPLDANWDTDWARLEQLGFILGRVVEGDPAFRSIQCPQGWTHEGPNSQGVSFLIDPRGFRHIGIVDRKVEGERSAHWVFLNVGYDLAEKLSHHQEGPHLPIEWSVLTEGERIEFYRGAECISSGDPSRSQRARALMVLAVEDDAAVACWAQDARVEASGWGPPGEV